MHNAVWDKMLAHYSGYQCRQFFFCSGAGDRVNQEYDVFVKQASIAVIEWFDKRCNI
jgi:hypothetical protein